MPRGPVRQPRFAVRARYNPRPVLSGRPCGPMITLEALRKPVEEPLRDVVRTFDDELACEYPFVVDLCRRAAGYRGKMLRPTLLLLSGQACGQLRREHVVLAAVVEMVHVATLVHDDVLDEA